MNDDHRTTFVSEAREHITDLNNALLALEDDPTDAEAMDSVFRTAHTLKGNFAAMGFTDASSLAHALEDLLDEIRAGEMTVSSEVMDVTFDAVDRIEAAVAAIEAGEDEEVDVSDTVESLRRTMDHADAEGDRETVTGDESDPAAGVTDDAGGDGAPVDGASGPGDEAAEFAHADAVPAFPGADRVVHARVTVDTGEMPGVEAMFVLEALAEGFEGFELAPSREAIEGGEYSGAFDVFLPDDEPAALAAGLETVGAVDSFEVTTIREAAGESESEDEPPGAEGDAGAGAPAGESEALDVAAAADESPAATDGSGSTPDAGDDAGGDAAAGRDAGPSADEIASVRVDVDRLDELHGLVEQLVTNRINIRRAVEAEEFESAKNSMSDLDKVTSRLQNTVMDMRLIPLRRVVSKLPRVVRDTARDSGKEVDFEMYGKDIELDRSILAEIGDPLIHILRNAVDHGIEPPQEREAAGKPPEGQVELRAKRERDHVTIVVEDDGAGLDADRLRRKAVSEGVLTEEEAAAMPDDEAHDLVFHPGLSTNEEVTDLSGRGVGMDVVHRTVEQLDGSVNVESIPGEGTTFRLQLPVSVAIVDVLFVAVGEQSYGIPIKNIDEITRDDDIEQLHGDDVVRHGDDVVPVVRLSEALDTGNGRGELAADGGSAAGSGPDTGGSATGGAGRDGIDGLTAGQGPMDRSGGMLVRIRPSEREVALRCDRVQDQEEVVVKPLDGALSGISELSGTAILGDGNIIPILNVREL
ncbi:chemotaxis protein CheA [Haloglomus halophilum]|uniref:chemotaxis protein CheA n=1 Tax=Haloglomus halophilum TaxID=2962672 RepID=UPI0020C98A79|nr:chemotaxis protein CheA [Haloglomus halophilum]